MPRGGGGRPIRMSIPKSLKSITDWKAILEKIQKDGKSWTSKIVIPAGGSFRKPLKNPAAEQKTKEDPLQSDISQTLLHNNSEKQQPKINRMQLFQQAWKSALPNLNLVTQQQQSSTIKSKSKNYIEMAHAIAKDAQALNSKVDKMSKTAKTVGSVIDQFQSSLEDGKNVNLDSSPKKSFWITTIGSGLYFMIMEQLPKILFHSDKW